MGDWILFEESTYANLCDLNINDADKWIESVFLVPEQVENIDTNPKLRVVLELVINALQYCINNQLSFPSAAILIDAIRNELNVLSNNESVIDNEACKSRYLESIAKYNTENSLPVQELKLITTFYSTHFLRHLESYQYVLLESWSEDQESRVLEVQTPLCPPLLSSAITSE